MKVRGMIKLKGINDSALIGQMTFDQYVYSWTSSERKNYEHELNVCVTVMSGDGHLELWFKEETCTLCEVTLVSIGDRHDFNTHNRISQTNGLICADPKILAPRRERKIKHQGKTLTYLDHCVEGHINSPISIAQKKNELEVDFGGIYTADQKIMGPNIVQFTSGQNLVGLSFKQIEEIDYQTS